MKLTLLINITGGICPVRNRSPWSLTRFIFYFSYESMSKLCERYNRAIDGILQLVSTVACIYWDHDVLYVSTRANQNVVVLNFSRGRLRIRKTGFVFYFCETIFICKIKKVGQFWGFWGAVSLVVKCCALRHATMFRIPEEGINNSRRL